MIIMIIAELSGSCRQTPIVLGGEGQSLGTKDTLSLRYLIMLIGKKFLKQLFSQCKLKSLNVFAKFESIA